MPTVESYVEGRWYAPPHPDIEVLDASTGEAVAQVCSVGVDLAATVDFGRTVGQASLRMLSFHQRALILKALGQFLMGIRKEFYPLSARTGATRGDSVFDVDGGIGVLLSYGSKGRRELPNDTIYVDGGVERLSRQGGFVGQHIYTSLPGVAVQINAFNFPVWGMLEKFAPAFLAGLPTIVKPATPSGYLAESVVRRIIESDLLPQGTLQLVSGSARGLLDYLDERDVVAFTGSASTAQELRAHPSIARGGVRFSAEADSLNCSILGPDAVPGTPEFDAYIGQLVTEMTVKAGQKCTAIRRALVPREMVEEVSDAVRARIADVVRVGAPGSDGVTMGPLVSLDQRTEVLGNLTTLVHRSAGHVVVGDPSHVEPIGADPERGAFLAPVLVRVDDPESAAVHEVEAFGPVSSILGYSDVDHAIRLAAKGRGSLVGSVVTADRDVARHVVLGLAPWHGRILVLDANAVPESTGHGSPLPHLVHGGPGRAGGSEELGGIRGVLRHMQRTAVQGSPDMLTAITGRWVTGAARGDESVHPFRKSLAELAIGDAVRSTSRVVSLGDIEYFAAFTGDTFYAHMDDEAAAANPFFPGRVAHGYLLLSFAAGLFVDPAPGPVLANYGLENLRFLTPVVPGDEIRVELTAKQITPRETDDYGEVRWDAVILNQRDEPVATYDVLTLVAKTPSL